MKVYKAVLHTGGKTDEQIKVFCGMSVSQEEIDLMRKTYDAFDGLECFVTDSPFNDGGYSYLGRATKEQADKEKEAVYLMEQDALFGSYVDERDNFDRDWDAGNYDFQGVWTFLKEDVEILAEDAK